LRYRILDYPDLPGRDAGAGVARKLGMDEALVRFARTPAADGVIASLDADCMVETGYLQNIVEHFRDTPTCPGVSIYFEHPLESIAEPSLLQAIAEYELHLRYYVAGMQAADFPYAFHTVGSALAFRVGAYARQGGMNRRQAGEDFYFVQKLIQLGGYQALTETAVFPTARLSRRVPFGTGAALLRAANSGTGLQTYPVQVFRDMRELCRLVEVNSVADLQLNASGLSPPLRAYLNEQDFAGKMREIRANVASPAAFRKRFFRWFNAFRFMKFVNFARRDFYAGQPVATAAAELLAWTAPDAQASSKTFDLLEAYRALERAPAPERLPRQIFAA
jgi:hypothetical protein